MKFNHKKTMKRYILPYFQLLAVAVLLLSSCAGHPDVPSSSREARMASVSSSMFAKAVPSIPEEYALSVPSSKRTRSRN